MAYGRHCKIDSFSSEDALAITLDQRSPDFPFSSPPKKRQCTRKRALLWLFTAVAVIVSTAVAVFFMCLQRPTISDMTVVLRQQPGQSIGSAFEVDGDRSPPSIIINLLMSATLTSPNFITLTMSNIQVKMYLQLEDGTAPSIGQGERLEPFEIPKRGQARLELPLTINATGSFNDPLVSSFMKYCSSSGPGYIPVHYAATIDIFVFHNYPAEQSDIQVPCPDGLGALSNLLMDSRVQRLLEAAGAAGMTLNQIRRTLDQANQLAESAASLDPTGILGRALGAVKNSDIKMSPQTVIDTIDTVQNNAERVRNDPVGTIKDATSVDEVVSSVVSNPVEAITGQASSPAADSVVSTVVSSEPANTAANTAAETVGNGVGNVGNAVGGLFGG